MKEELRDLVRGAEGTTARNRVREYLQARILASLQRSSAMISLAFQGGTALRFLYSIRRYWEDLDFALERPERGYDFRGYLKSIQRDLKQEGYEAEVKVNDVKTVHNAFVGFTGLLFDLGVSPHRNEKLSVKLEVDTRPPAGAILETTVVCGHLTLQLQHHDRASLLADRALRSSQRSAVAQCAWLGLTARRLAAGLSGQGLRCGREKTALLAACFGVAEFPTPRCAASIRQSGVPTR